MIAGTSSRPRNFTLRVPPSWFEFDVWRATRTGDLARLVDDRIAADSRLRSWRAALLKALREAAEQAERQGAVLCAAMTDPVAEVGVLAAILSVFHTTGSPLPGGNTVEAMAAQIPATAGDGDESTWRQVEIVEIPAGAAVRVRGVDVVQLGEHQQRCVLMQTLVPVPDGRGVLNVVLASPQTELTEPMLDLFEAISETLAWTNQGTTGAENGSGPTDPEGQ